MANLQNNKPKEVLSIEREAVITTLKPRLIAGLSEIIVSDVDKQDFITLCRRVESTVRAWYRGQFEEMMQLFLLFDPVGGRKRLEKQNLSPSQVDSLEERFLMHLFLIMRKSQHKLVTDQELKVATNGHYMLDIPITVDNGKIDYKLFSRYFSKNYDADEPSYAHQYLLFRRGLGVDRTSGTFINEKIDMLLSKLWKAILVSLRLKKPEPPLGAEVASLTKRSDKLTAADADRTVVERHRIDNLPLTFKNMFGKVTLQEPTFERIILVYRKSTPEDFSSDLGDRAIHIMNFHDIPMADVEICLPEKKNPGLTPQDWLRFIITAAGGLYAVTATLEAKVSLTVVYAILVATLGYLSKVYFTWQASMAKYHNLIMTSVYNKHLDSGQGTLLHICDDVIQQEVKEVIVAYFALMTQGKATKDELDRRCEDLMMDEFKEDIDFDVVDAVDKLVRLGIVTKNPSGHLSHQSLKQANEIIGVTTDELVEAHRPPPDFLTN